ncbi:MAG: A/G-specific adenine glycosylase [Acidobacteriaceae bacterium]|nr:A/G-specific adenine glycosylase [Acidobacteriaceae bacterium]
MTRLRRTPDASLPDSSADNAPLVPFDPAAFSRRLFLWYRDNARVLPWRNIDSPYGTWLSEIMLQQTRVATVIERYGEFLERFPTIAALAEAQEPEVLALWSGLGYYRRARMLHRGAQFVMREFNGKLPRDSRTLRSLPGVGDYTAAAIASIAFREQIAVVDGNVERVLFRILGQPEDRSSAARTRLSRIAQSLVPPPLTPRARANPPGDHNQAMMELGATVCTPRAPLCLHCPVVDFCITRGEHHTVPRDKQRSRTVAHLLALRKRGTGTEVLLERRPDTASLMPGMTELPPLPLEAVADREPVLRLRHAITNTNYYVELYAESAPGVPPYLDPDNPAILEEGLVVADPEDTPHDTYLQQSIPASEANLFWVATSTLPMQPLTGLARKALQRMGVMRIPRPKIAHRTPTPLA